jgi:hypothetical protein
MVFTAQQQKRCKFTGFFRIKFTFWFWNNRNGCKKVNLISKTMRKLYIMDLQPHCTYFFSRISSFHFSLSEEPEILCDASSFRFTSRWFISFFWWFWLEKPAILSPEFLVFISHSICHISPWNLVWRLCSCPLNLRFISKKICNCLFEKRREI